MSTAALSPVAPVSDTTHDWYRDAIIYQLHVRAYHDSDGDGIGDFRGLTEKLDYIQSLGVTALWILPFYPSPLRDGGYDIADYVSVNPTYGTLKDFRAFLREAHRRDLRVITELVMNHTSDQHPWFQRARRAKPGGRWRDFYVWSDTPEKYKDTRIIFKDFEPSNWSWDPVANAYFWHRFYAHQPDLNFDNLEVHRAMFEVLDFWLEMGVDGMRLDAVPYLYEREGTTCENLPETHEFLKKVRKYIDDHYENRMLLAEANQWPEDAVAYFGSGDECHMNFHFPLMPRLFMSIQREDRFPIIDIMDQTPALPPNSQWAIFLRNHDELTLEMVTDEERDYMYRAYADEIQARINLGIRRRLAPLLKNNRRKLELMNGLLLSLPGTPVIYYGDEIGMGDNIYLGDRDGVRTPMQWSADRNGGFSKANPQKLFLPPIIDPEYHYSAVNVETEQNSPHSILWWMRRLISLRKQFHVFGRGSLEFLLPENPKVLVFVRQHQDETILVVANLSRFVQYAELDLSRFKGMVPIELFGQTKFPAIGELPYFLTIGPYGFYWLKLERRRDEAVAISTRDLPSARVKGGWDGVFRTRARTTLESVLPDYLNRQRWFGGKARTVQSLRVLDAIPLEAKDQNGSGLASRLVLIRVEYTEGEPDIYQLPIGFAAGEQAQRLRTDRAASILMALNPSDDSEGLLYEATLEPPFWAALYETIARRRSHRGDNGELTGHRTRFFRRQSGHGEVPREPSIHGGEQSNTSAVFGDRFIMKLFRRVQAGINPDHEVSRFLTEKVRVEHIPALAGAVEYQQGRHEPQTLAILHQFQPNEGDAWRFTLDELGRYVERILSERADAPPDPRLHPKLSILDLAEQETPAEAREIIGHVLQAAELLGRRTAELHLALASRDDDPAFAPEPFTPFYQRGLFQSMRAQAAQSFQRLRKQRSKLPEPFQADAAAVLEKESEVVGRFRALVNLKITALRIRTHGDYHLGQVLYTGKDFVIIDFEGEPDRPVSERRIKRSALRDVAGMLRSFDYAASAAHLGQLRGVEIPAERVESTQGWLRVWYTWVSAAFLREYLAVTGQAGFLPRTRQELEVLLNAYVLEKLLYELSYELNNRPEWARIPMQGILRLSEG